MNGLLYCSTPGIGLINTNTNNVFIGQYTLGGDYYFDGVLDDIKIFSRALNEYEISNLYHEGGWDN